MPVTKEALACATAWLEDKSCRSLTIPGIPAMLRAVLEKGKNYHDVFFSDLPFFNVENIVNLATNGGTKKPFGMVKVLFQHLRDYPNLLVSTMLQVARLAPEGFAICRREGGFVTIEFRHFDILEMCEFWEVCVANVSEPVTQIGTKIKDIHKLIAKCMDKNMFFQAKRLQNLLNVSTGSILAAMKDMGDYWKLGVIQATSILPPSMFVGDLVTLLEVRSCCTQGDVVQQLLDGKRLSRVDFSRMTRNSKYSIFKLFLAVQCALMHRIEHGTPFVAGVNEILFQYAEPVFSELANYDKRYEHFPAVAVMEPTKRRRREM